MFRWLLIIVLCALIVGFVILAVPDIRRYLKIRSM
jgi:hypothetical protein